LSQKSSGHVGPATAQACLSLSSSSTADFWRAFDKRCSTCNISSDRFAEARPYLSQSWMGRRFPLLHPSHDRSSSRSRSNRAMRGSGTWLRSLPWLSGVWCSWQASCTGRLREFADDSCAHPLSCSLTALYSVPTQFESCSHDIINRPMNEEEWNQMRLPLTLQDAQRLGVCVCACVRERERVHICVFVCVCV
jgi:hypothetical protein